MEIANSSLEFLEISKDIFNKGGPDIQEYEFLKNIPEEVVNSPLEIQQKIYSLMSPILTTDSMIGFTFLKPHGYAGDFELLHRIYSKWKSDDKNLYKWDNFYHNLEGAKAVRNRKSYFKDLLLNIVELKNSPLVLNLGSGPCVDLFECLRKEQVNGVRFDCLDMDNDAIDYAACVCDNYIENINFINQNALTFSPDYQYDLIWTAGLFDYFNDKIFIRLLRRLYSLVKKNGELVIGNFSECNPSKTAMEFYGQWYLHHRSADKLIEIALKADIPKELIKVSHEKSGVNLFLHLSKE